MNSLQGTFEDLSIINEVFFKRCIAKSIESFGIEELISILETMASLCSSEKMGMNLKSFCPDSSPPSSYQEQSWMICNQYESVSSRHLKKSA
jgi:hypothetical protein